jgi:hypothetical protein
MGDIVSAIAGGVNSVLATYFVMGPLFHAQ